MPDQAVDQRWKRRTEYHLEALASGWEVDAVSPQHAYFGRDGWRIEVRWSDNDLPIALVVRDPNGLVVESRSFLLHKWGVGEELEAQLKSPGPLREPHVPLESSVSGLLQLFEQLDPDRKFTAGFIAEKLRDCLSEAS